MQLIESRIGAGRFVCGPNKATGPADQLDVNTIAAASARDFTEMRRILEIPMAELAADRATSQQVSRIKYALDLSEVQCGDPVACDVAFHSSIAEASGNVILRRYVSTGLLLMYHLLMLTQVVHGREAKTLEDHRRLYEAIRAHDPLAARQAMEEHLAFSAKGFSDALGLSHFTAGQAVAARATVAESP